MSRNNRPDRPRREREAERKRDAPPIVVPAEISHCTFRGTGRAAKAAGSCRSVRSGVPARRENGKRGRLKRHPSLWLSI
ncbi:hypothetical protein JCM2811A_21740 [Methylorubrum rhodinum]